MGTTDICETCNSKGYGRCVCENAPSSCTVDSIVMNWTPVKKAMPQGGRMCISDAVLVTVSNLPDDFHVVRVDRYDAHSKTWEHSNPQHDRARVTAWMPLPDPYKPNGKG
jgi:hypothetical protein